VLSRIMIDGMPDENRFVEIVGGTIARTRAALNDVHSEIVIFGEMVSLLWLEGKTEAAIRLEQLWNELTKEHSFSLRCAYPIADFCDGKSGLPLIRVCAEHSAVVFDQSDKPLRGGRSKIALQRSEEPFRLFVDAVQDYAIFMLDPQGHISSWNNGAARIKGYGVSEILGKHFSVFYPEEDRRSGKPQKELEIAAREGRVEDEGWRLRKDGSRFWANVIITALRDDAGRLVGFGKVTRDFTGKINAEVELRKEIEERKKAEEKLQDSEKSLRQLSFRLLQTQDEERRRVGRDLHDSVGQYLAALKMRLDSLQSSAKRNQRVKISALAECAQLAEQAITEVRTLSHLLFPPLLEELGLKSAIPWYLEGFATRSGIKTTVEIAPDFDRVAPELELAVFRVLQESLTNVHRHSGSPTAHVRLQTKNRVVILQVKDEGKGIPLNNLHVPAQDRMAALGVGLRSMNERLRQLGGTLEISSSRKGTTINASIPMPEGESDLSLEKLAHENAPSK
ncbi:MAG TPA: PAS domain S-box protein, partial [Candidatus Limnocylindrales bacterium]|nr:PAS domain S-box protein [Candidatus Limnocylindrales bacterium]